MNAYGLVAVIEFPVQDLARLFLWVVRNYEEVEPIILSGEAIG